MVGRKIGEKYQEEKFNYERQNTCEIFAEKNMKTNITGIKKNLNGHPGYLPDNEEAWEDSNG